VLAEHIDINSLFYSVEALDQIKSASDFISFCRNELQSILPHGAFIVWTGQIGKPVEGALFTLAANIPSKYLEAIYARGASDLSLTGQNWWESGEPEFYALGAQTASPDAEWLKCFSSSGLKNTVSFGVLDTAPEHATFFSFYQLPEDSRARCRQALKLFAPHLHHAFLKLSCASTLLTPPNRNGGSRYSLTQREREVLGWVRQGKTNAEIASILGVAYKTVKNQVQSILVKLRVNNRAQAVAVAIEFGLV
jgi:transcriptional regulator EpsA